MTEEFTEVFGTLNIENAFNEKVKKEVSDDISSIIENSEGDPGARSQLLTDYVMDKISVGKKDSLTGLLTSRESFAQIEYLAEIRSRIDIGKVSVLVIDIDNFKKINDEKGHAEGDKLLNALAQVISSHKRASDIVSRSYLKGDEILGVYPGSDEINTRGIGQKISEEWETSENNIWNSTVSFGVSEWDLDQDFNEALNEADKNMYEVKNAKKINQ